MYGMKTIYPTFFFYSFFCIYLLLLLHILTLTDFTLHFSCCFTKILHSQLNPLLNNFTMQEKCY